MNFLSMLMNSKKQLNPKAYGFAHRKAKDEINLRSFYISKECVHPFAKSLSLSSQVKKLNLSRTRLSEHAAVEVIKNIPIHLQDLDLSGNPNIHHGVVKVLCAYVLENARSLLRSLELENCNVRDEGALHLSKALLGRCQLRFLNLASNEIKEAGAQHISRSLQQNKCLLVLFLHWNPIRHSGGKYIAKAMQQNQSLQVLDLSFCGLGQKKDSNAGIWKPKTSMA